MFQRLISIIVFSGVIFCNITYADEALKFQNISVEEGLSHSYVNSILQDSKGYLWINTFMGTNRYDGYNFVHYTHNPEDSSSISSSTVYTAFEDRDSNLWFGTEKGLNRYVPDKNRFISYENITGDTNSISSNKVHSIIQDAQGRLWVGTYGGGLNSFDPVTGRFKHFTYQKGNPNSIQSNLVNTILIDNHNNFWVGTEAGGVSLFNPEKGTFSNFKTEVPDSKLAEIDNVTSFYEDNRGKVWICSWFHGLYEVDPVTMKVVNYRYSPYNKNSLSHNSVRAITQDRQGNFWIATFGGGLNKLEIKTHKFTCYKSLPGSYSDFPSSFLWNIFTDRTGVIWLITLGKGVYHFTTNTEKFRYYPIDLDSQRNFNGSNSTVISFYNSDNNTIWIGTGGDGVKVFDRKKDEIKSLKLGDLDLKKNIYSFFKDRQNRLWIGTDKGLISYDEKSKNFIQYRNDPDNENSITDGSIVDITEDADENIWLIFYSGDINILTSDESKKNNPKTVVFKKLSQNKRKNGLTIYYNDICCDHNGDIWIATSNSLSKYNRVQENFDPVLKENITIIHEDKEGILWLGTWGNGLIKYNPETGRRNYYSEAQGFPNYNIYGILEDNNNNLWISSNGGITRFDKSVGTFRNFSENKTLQSVSFRQHCYLLLNSGEMMFGGSKGFILFQPDNFRPGNEHPNIEITNFRIFNRSIKPGEEINGKTILDHAIDQTKSITLTHREKMITFEFAVLSFNAPNKNNYFYKLEGYDTSWTAATASNHTATYINLTPGNYIFKVKGTDANGVWSDHTATIAITILPSFWNRWKILLMSIIIVFIVALILFVQWSKKQFLEKKRIAELAENSIKDERSLLRTLIDSIPDTIYIKDCNSKFILANKRLSEIMHINPPSALIGKWDFDYFPNEMASQYYNDEQEIIRTGKPLIGKSEKVMDEYGNIRAFSTTKMPLRNNKGEIIGILGIGRDITQLTNIEKELRKNSEILQETNTLLEERQEKVEQQAETLRIQADTLRRMNAELEKLNQTKDKFFSIIAHDLKNPFGSLLNFIDLLDINYDKWPDVKKRNILKVLKKSSESIYNLLENLLQWSRTQRGTIDFDPEEFDLVELTSRNLEFVRGQSSLKNITISHAYSPDHIRVIADKKMIETVIRNLLNNAIKFTHREGEIFVDIQVISSNVEVSVKDTGMGMSEDIRNRLFKIGDNISTTGTENETGTGLGLLLCHEFIKKHEGVIRVESKPGKGSNFTFAIPLKVV